METIPASWESGGGISGAKADLPDLPSTSSPLQFGDWIHLCGPVMRDLSSVASRWWDLTTRQAQNHYADWKMATPLQRVQIEPRIPDELNERCYGRTEQRGVHLLLKAVSTEIQQMLVTDRQLTSTAILYRLFIRYQPGGPGEKSLILKELTQLPKTQTMAELATALRSWRRHFGRAREVGASLPDGTLLIRALEVGVQQVAKENSQAAFRLAQSRSALKVDEQPEPTTIWDFSQCLLAEAETLVLMNSSLTVHADPPPLKLKVFDAGDGNSGFKKAGQEAATNGKGKGGTSEVPCRWFRSDGGCRAGKQCKFNHSWDGIDDKSARCWICGSKEHRKNDCKVKGSGPRRDEPKGSGGGSNALHGNGNNKSGGGGTTPSTSSTPSAMTPVKPKINEMTAASATTATTTPGELKTGNSGGEKVDAGKDMGENGGDGGGKSSRTDELLQEATQLLKTLRVQPGNPKMKVMQIGGLDRIEENMVLIDSGATHGLRPAVDFDEWNKASPTTVQLATGSTQAFRLKPNTKILLGHPTDSTAWIVPMGGLAELDFILEWKENLCSLKDDVGRSLNVTVINGCPMLTREEGQMVLQWLEGYQVHQWRKMAVLKTIFTRPEEVDKSQLDLELALTMKLRQQFPDLLDDIMAKIVPRMEMIKTENFGNKLPWNRRKRRRLKTAKHVVIHLFSGPDQAFWDKQCASTTTEVLCIDTTTSTPANLHDRFVYGFLVALCASGKVRSILAGPPCRTLSALRYQNDEGPGILRTEEFPYGVPDLSAGDQELVSGDSVLMFRFWSLYILAEEFKPISMPPTQFFMEQPEDPARYRNAQDVEEHKYFSIFRTREWQQMAETFGIRLVHFDQFPMGHPKRKPTTLATNVPEMMQLQDIRGAPTNEAELTNQFRSLPLTKRLDESKKWAAWAPGLKLAIATVIRQHVNMLDQERVAQQWAEPALLRPRSESPEQHQEHFSVPQFEPDSVQSRNEPSSVRQQQGPASVQNQIKPTVQALGVVALEQWKKHFLNDHMPARRDCSHCVRAQGRSKPHRRVQHPESYTLSIDLSGKMSEGMDQNAQGVKYMMVGCYTMPISKDRRSLIPVPGQEHEEQDQPLPGVDEDIEGIQMDEEDHVPPDDDVLLEEDEPMEEGDERHVRSAQSMCATWQRLVDEAQNVAVHQITFVEPLKSRAVKHVLPALARMYCRLRSLGLPLYRLHSDRAKEFCSEPVRTWALERDILITMTPGSSFKANGRVEGEMNTIKKSIRTLISAQLSTLQQWPLAARHIGERRLRAQLQLLGWPVGRMLRFGATAYALRKSWQARYVAWRDIREEVKILGPDMNSSLTNTGYYVESKTTGRRFYTDDVVIPEAQQPAVEDQVLYLPERAEDAAPMRRHRTKEKVPAISMMNMEGERVITQRFSDMFDNDPYYVNSSDSWTLGTDDQSSASSSPKRTTDLEEEWWIGVGDVEEAPNNRAGSSYPVASNAAALRALHVNLTNHVGDEMQKLDAVSSDQAWWLGAVSDAIKMRNMVEQRLQDLHEQDAQDQQHNMEQEFLVTRTIGNAEVWADLEAWSPSIKQEYDQLVKKKCAVRQITKSQLQQMASELKLPIEILPGKMVHTRKSGTGAYRSRAVICGNYAGPENNEHYAGGVDVGSKFERW